MSDREEDSFLNSIMMRNSVEGDKSEDSDGPGADNSDSDDYEPSQTVHVESPVVQNSSTIARTDIPCHSPDHSSDGSSVGSPKTKRSPSDTDSPVPSRPDPRTNVKPNIKRRTIGGFIIEDDDDDDDAVHQPSRSELSGSVLEGIASDRTASQTPDRAGLKTTSIQGTPRELAQDGGNGGDGNAASDVNDSITASKDDDAATDQATVAQVKFSEQATPSGVLTPTVVLPKARLPHDRIGILEDRIKEDPRGDVDSWLSLIAEHRKRDKLDDARKLYERFFRVFPFAAEQWVDYAQMENQNNDFYRLETIFRNTLLKLPYVQLWSFYLDYIRRRNNLTTDVDGKARQIIAQAYNVALAHVGMDKDSGSLWQDYVQFIRTGPGIIGENNWQGQQKMDLLRKTYQQAICVPTQAVNVLWKEYDLFEMGLNKMTGRRFLQEKSPAYMSARSSYTELQNITKNLNRTTLPRLPPAAGCEGEEEFFKQLNIWKRWIKWEKDDPLVLKDEDPAAYKGRIIYVYKQALMAMRFWPELWFDAAEFCFNNGMEAEGKEFLDQGILANPESCLLAFKKADRLEATTTAEEGDESLKRRGAIVREPYDKLLDTLYDLISKVKAHENREIALVEQQFVESQEKSPISRNFNNNGDQDDDDSASFKENTKIAQIDAIRKSFTPQTNLLSRTISFAWIALMRAMRRIQGKGKIGDPIGGCRQIFADARKRGRLTSDVYLASALIEYHCYKDQAANKIFERGTKLFPDDEKFALEYLKHLISTNDITNASAFFATTVSKFEQKPETVAKVQSIYAFYHRYTSQYGELDQVVQLEKRMNELFPEDPKLTHFAHRFSDEEFDPTVVRPVVSPTQSRPKTTTPADAVASIPNSPVAGMFPPISSPKRPAEDSDSDSNRPRKVARGESPMRGPTVRRDQSRRSAQANGPGVGPYMSQPVSAPSIPREIWHLLSIIPKAHTYQATKFVPEKLINLLRTTGLPANPPGTQSRPTTISVTSAQMSFSTGQYSNGYSLPNQPYNPSNLRQQVSYIPSNMTNTYAGQRYPSS